MPLPVELRQWATRHHVGHDALAELSALLGHVSNAEAGEGRSESNVQSRVRLAAPQNGMRLWRNNRGALLDVRGVPVRFGLANDTQKLGERLASHDLIGWRRLLVSPAMVGATIAQFASIECKHEGWRPGEHPDREAAQMRWGALVVAEGGYSKLATGPEQL